MADGKRAARHTGESGGRRAKHNIIYIIYTSVALQAKEQGRAEREAAAARLADAAKWERRLKGLSVSVAVSVVNRADAAGVSTQVCCACVCVCVYVCMYVCMYVEREAI